MHLEGKGEGVPDVSELVGGPCPGHTEVYVKAIQQDQDMMYRVVCVIEERQTC